MNCAGCWEISVGFVFSARFLVTGLFPSPRSYVTFRGAVVGLLITPVFVDSSGCVFGKILTCFVGRSNGATSGGPAVADDLKASANGDDMNARTKAHASTILRALFIDDCFILLSCFCLCDL